MEEEGRALREGLSSYRAALEPLMRKEVEKQVLKMGQGVPATEPEEGKAGEGEVDGEHDEDDGEGPFPASGSWAGLLALPIW
jgi:hypothetical protein